MHRNPHLRPHPGHSLSDRHQKNEPRRRHNCPAYPYFILWVPRVDHRLESLGPLDWDGRRDVRIWWIPNYCKDGTIQMGEAYYETDTNLVPHDGQNLCAVLVKFPHDLHFTFTREYTGVVTGSLAVPPSKRRERVCLASSKF